MNENYIRIKKKNFELTKIRFYSRDIIFNKLLIEVLARVHMILMFVVEDIDFSNRMELYHRQ